jgi:hypothetical protein
MGAQSDPPLPRPPPPHGQRLIAMTLTRGDHVQPDGPTQATRRPLALRLPRATRHSPPPRRGPRQVSLVGDDWRRWQIKLPPTAFDDDLPGGKALRGDLQLLARQTGGGYILMEAKVGAWQKAEPTILFA